MPSEHQQHHQALTHASHAEVFAKALEAKLRSEAPTAADQPAQMTTQAAFITELRAQGDQLRAERDRLVEQQRRVAELLNCKDPAMIVHDLRNMLNELQLYKHLADTSAPNV